MGYARSLRVCRAIHNTAVIIKVKRINNQMDQNAKIWIYNEFRRNYTLVVDVTQIVQMLIFLTYAAARIVRLDLCEYVCMERV